MEDLNTLYINRANAFANRANRFRKQAQLYSGGRLVIAVAMLICLWNAVMTVSTFWINLVLLGILCFAITAWLDARANKKAQYFNRLRTINEHERTALSGDLSRFEKGERYLDPAHPFTYDLDIFGDYSIFQLLNRTCTSRGESMLVKNLQEGSFPPENLLERQNAIKELSTFVDFRHHFLAIGREYKEESTEIEQLISWMDSPASFVNRPLIRFLRFLLPTITIITTVLAAIDMFPSSLILLSVLINFGFLQCYHKQIDKTHAIVSRKQHLLEKYASLLKLINNEIFVDRTLLSIHADSKKASNAIHKLSVIISFFDQRLNNGIAFITNGFLLCDLHCIAALDRWKKHHINSLTAWLDSLFNMDELNSLANFAFNHPDYVYPEFSDSVFIEAKDLGHPLIKESACIVNDFSSSPGEKVVVLTGANMAGKSTFLRSLGVNLVLASIGSPVFARSFRCGQTAVYSSMRVTDALKQDTSYFYAELKRLCSIMENLRSNKKMVILLDEVLKGTNSLDKLQGSIGLVEEFLTHNCFGVIATHDLTLGDLEDKYPGQVTNYCFESEILHDALTFDYKIKRGIAQNRNATFLMKQLGVIK